jgi:L-fucono-1,5-lactonase
MRRIDSHQHFWELSRFSYPWMPPAPSTLSQDHMPERLSELLQEYRFDGSIAVQATTTLDETRWLLDLAEKNAFVLGVVGWVDLTSPSLGTVLDELQRHPRFRGVRHPVQDESDDRWLVRREVLDGLKELSRRGIPYDLLLRPRHLPLAPLVSDAVPELRMVIDHLAKPDIAHHVMDPWAADLARAAQSPNVYCKLSGMVTEADQAHWKSEHFRPYLRHAMEVFGPARLMFGSDWPVCRLVASWKQVLAAFTQAIGAQPDTVRERLLGGTAIDFYKLSV